MNQMASWIAPEAKSFLHCGEQEHPASHNDKCDTGATSSTPGS